MVNTLFIAITVFIGLTLLYAARHNKDSLKIGIIILAFFVARIFFGLDWRLMTGSLDAISFENDFLLLLILNFSLLSAIFIFGVNCIIKKNLQSIGWVKKGLLKNIFFGAVVGGVFFLALTFQKTIEYENLIIAVFFSFCIASWQEENIFRGYLLEFLNKKYDSMESVMYQAFIFSVAHIGFYSFFPVVNLLFSLVFAFITGLIFGYLRVKTDSQISAFIAHGLIDVAILIV